MTTTFSYLCTNETLDQYFHEIANIPFLTKDEEIELGNKALSGNLEARNALVNSHLKYVVSIAKKYIVSGVEFADLISEGNIGLLYAVEGFNPKEGKLATYASFWIKKSICDAIREKSGITHTDYKTDRFEDYKSQLKQKLSTAENEVEPFKWIDVVKSLDDYISDEEDTTIKDFLADETQNPEDKIIASNLADKISDILDDYSELQKAFIVNYFGLENKKPISIEDIAEAYKVPVSKVDTTIKKTLRSLRTNEKVKALRGFCQE